MNNDQILISKKNVFRTNPPILYPLLIIFCVLPLLQGCPQDRTPLLEEENAELKKLAAKQESMIITLQEGNRFAGTN